MSLDSHRNFNGRGRLTNTISGRLLIQEVGSLLELDSDTTDGKHPHWIKNSPKGQRITQTSERDHIFIQNLKAIGV